MKMEIIYETDNWKFAIEELRAIITEQGYITRLNFIKMKWMIGERIESDEKISSHKKEIAEELGIPISEINRCTRFYRWTGETLKVKDWEEVENILEKDSSWHKIVNNLIPGPKDEEDAKEEERLKKMREKERIRKVYKILEYLQKQNEFESVDSLLTYLIEEYDIDINKNY